MGSIKKRDMEIRAKSLSRSGRLLGYCAKHNGQKGVALLDGKNECLAFIPWEDIKKKLDSGPYINV